VTVDAAMSIAKGLHWEETADFGASLYDGSAGIAIALGACSAVAGDAQLARTARGAVEHALAAAPDMLEIGCLGLFDGVTGVVLAGRLVSRALDDSRLATKTDALAKLLNRTRVGDDFGLDLTSGSAGVVLGALALDLPQLAESHCARLIDAAEPQLWGSAWPSDSSPGRRPLLGLGHGAAGMALALGEFGAVHGDRVAQDMCMAAAEYERSWYDPDRVAWPDLREVGPAGEPAGWMHAWCHGATGVGLSRLRLSALVGDRALLAEASAALQAARDLVVQSGTALRDSSVVSDCSACHGLAGVVELELVAAAACGVDAHRRAGARTAVLMVEQRDRAGRWPCGGPEQAESAGLMLGTSGIALTLLRAAGVTDMPTPLLPGPSGW